ncbi:hypothetical protein ACET3Z_016556 [Daucus carota]
MNRGMELAVRELMFNDEEVKGIDEFMMGDGDHATVTCGCTSHRLGDTVGTLRVYLDGSLKIECYCPGCADEGALISPFAFVKHAQRETTKKWRHNIWVITDGIKVPLKKTALLKYYNRALQIVRANRPQTGRANHHDEFVCCAVCGKERRFHRRNKEECRAYHDASRNVNWQCSDMPNGRNGRLQCGDKEERATRRMYKRCTRSKTCTGCTKCVCFGCVTCRFEDCSCQSCVDFTRTMENRRNAENYQVSGSFPTS